MPPWSFTVKWLAGEPLNDKAPSDSHQLPSLRQINLFPETEPSVPSEPVKRLAHSWDLPPCATPVVQLITNEQVIVAEVSTLSEMLSLFQPHFGLTNLSSPQVFA